MIPLILFKLAPYAAAGALAVGLATFTPVIGFNARMDRLEASRDTWKAGAEKWEKATGAWQASYALSETRRATERKDSLKAVEAMQGECTVRVAEARRSSRAIRSLVNAPVKTDATGCPARAIMDADGVLDALQPRPGR